MALGRLRRSDPPIAAHTLSGALFAASLMHAKVGRPSSATEAEAFADRVVDLLWAGLAPLDARDLLCRPCHQEVRLCQ
jgi:hypothetical protein